MVEHTGILHGMDSHLVDNQFVEGIFETGDNLRQRLSEWGNTELPVCDTKLGKITGDRDFIDFTLGTFNRRNEEAASDKTMSNDRPFREVAEVIKCFEAKNGVKIDEIDIGNHRGKKLRAELLVLLKDDAGLKYAEIAAYPLYKSLRCHSLGKLYKRTKDGYY